jgi:hypothetical protein
MFLLLFSRMFISTCFFLAKRDTPICLPLPGGFNSFCGRIYGIGREKNDFKACLGLELRADDELEAAMRVSCFRFGEKGLRVSEAEPIPVPTATKDDDDDDDDFDLFGLADDGSDDDEDDPLGLDGKLD